jgi:hypothetical protein
VFRSNEWSFVCLALIIPFSSGLFAVTRPSINVPYTTDPFTVDGNAVDWAGIKSKGKGISFYKGDGHAGTSANLGTTLCREIDNEADARVDLWLAHDGTYLYVLAEIKDDDYEPFDAANQNNMAYLEDTLHLYIDSTNARRSNIPDPPIYNQSGYEQFGISTDGNVWAENTDFNNSGMARQTAPKGSHPDGNYWVAECVVQPLSGGYLYTFEQRIALAGWPGKNMAAMTPGISYGFNAEFCDADNGRQLEGFIWWSSDGSTDAWNYQNLWGTMILETTPADFEPDGDVDLRDFAILASAWLSRPEDDNWNSVCDISKPADNVVDVLDLTVLAEYWLTYPGALAHWKLDEEQGYIVHDSTADHDGSVMTQNPLWRPVGGAVDGALELDGIQDYVSIPFVLNPKGGEFSILAWVKGGSPGQVIVSQVGGADWLCADPSHGYLMTQLRYSGRFSGPLCSQASIIDGQWHHVALTWDGSYRTLYLDWAEVATDLDPQPGLQDASGGLYFGAGRNLSAESFWSGLLDDIRIYKRALKLK